MSVGIGAIRSRTPSASPRPTSSGWVAADFGLDQLDAYQLVSQAVESPIANVVDTNYTSVAKLRQAVAAQRYEVYGGMHTPASRAVATAYRYGAASR